MSNVPKSFGAPIEPSAIEVLQTFQKSPDYQAIVAKAEATKATRRKVICDEMAKAETASEKRWHKHCAAIEEAALRLKEIDVAQLKARQALGAAQQARTADSFAYTAQHDELETELRASAHPLIKLFIREMQDDSTWSRKQTTIHGTEIQPTQVTAEKSLTHSATRAPVRTRP